MHKHIFKLLKTLAISGSIALLLLFAAGSAAQTKKNIYLFTGGSEPNGGLIFDGAGNLYGTASGGSCTVSTSGCGIVYELSPSGRTWTQTVINTFSGANGAYPQGGVIFDSRGDLYGVTAQGGAYNAGVVFELSLTTSGWTEQVLCNFSGGSDGGTPIAGIALDGSGNVYGTTPAGGTSNAGVVYQLTQVSSTWTENVLLNFADNAATAPSALAMDGFGNLYGTATNGESHNYDNGTVFELSPGAGGTWTTALIHTFWDTSNRGTKPVNGVAIDGAGNLYGMTSGVVLTCCAGVVYELQAPSWTESILKTLTWGIFGGIRNEPNGPVTLDAAGNLYGAVSNQDVGAVKTYDGFVFRIGPAGNSQYTFPALLPANKVYPAGGLAIDSQGNAYGVTQPYSSNGIAAVFEVSFPL